MQIADRLRIFLGGQVSSLCEFFHLQKNFEKKTFGISWNFQLEAKNDMFCLYFSALNK